MTDYRITTQIRCQLTYVVCVSSGNGLDAQETCTGIFDTLIQSKEGTEHIVDALHEVDVLKVFMEVDRGLKDGFYTRCRYNGSLRRFECSFAWQVGKFNLLATIRKLSESVNL